MRHYPVYYQDGMFLCPQHLQAADRHALEQASLQGRCMSPFPYGFLTLDGEVKEGVVRIHSCSGATRTGRPFSFPAEHYDAEDTNVATSLTFDLTRCPELRKHGSILIDLLLPAEEHRFPPGSGWRGETFLRHERDENRREEDPPLIEFKPCDARLQFRLTDKQIETRALNGLTVLPAFRVVETVKSRKRSYCLDPKYLAAWLALSREQAENHLGGLIGDLQSTLADCRIACQGTKGGLRGRGAANSAMPLLLLTLGRARGRLSAMMNLEKLSPSGLYVELASIIGELAVLDEDALPDIPPYNHDDLGGCLAALANLMKGQIDGLLPPPGTSEGALPPSGS